MSVLTATTEYKVEASLKSGFPTNQSEFDVFPTKPNKPTGLTVTSDDEQLEVEWTKPVGGDAIDEYIVQWKSGSETFADAETENREQTVAHVSGTTTYDATIPGLENGTEYTLQVIAKNDSGQAISDTKTGIPATLPDAPKNLDVAPGSEKLALTWEAPDETGGINITGYKVQWKDSSVADWNSPTGVTEVSVSGLTREITGLTNGTTYDVRVRADNGVTSDDYNWAVDDGTPRPEPTVTGVTVADTSITRTTATATVAIDNQTSDSQTVHLRHRNTAESGWTDVPTKDTAGSSETFDLSSLTGNTEYVVEAWLAATPNTKESATFTTDPVEPDAPRNVRITGHGDRELTVAWDAPSDTGGSQITDYKVQWKSGSDGYDPNLRQDEPGASPHTIDQLANGTEYTVQVIAVTTAGDGSPSTEAKGTPSRKPDAPIIQSVTPGHTQLVVTWSEPANGGNPIANYKIEYKEQDAQSWRLHKEVDHNTLTETIGSLTNGTIYVVQVSAKNINGYGDPSVEEPGTPRPDPSVSGVTVAETSITRTTAIATVAIDNQTSESQTVHLRHRVNTSGSLWTDATPKDTSAATETFDLSSLTGNTEYVVEAWLVATSSTKESVTFTTDPVEADAPRNVRITGHGNKELTVAWDAPSDTGGSQITGYKVQWKLSSQNDWNTSTEREDDDDQSPYKITENLTNGDEYAVRIIAVTSAGDGSPSNEAKDTPRTIPDAPTITNVTVSDRKLTITWTAPNEDGGAEITGYKVQWKDNSVTTDWDSSTGVTEVSESGLTREISGLTNGTTYGVRVRADNGETSTAYNWGEDSGIPKPDPSVGSVSVDEIEQTTAVATVTIADPTSAPKMVHLHYRVNSSSEAWTTPTPQSTTTNSVAFPQFTGLKSDTEYRIEAALDSAFNSGVQFKLFTTKRPTVSSVEIDENTITQAGATATVTILEPNGRQQTVRLRYRPHTQDDWSTTATDAGEILVNTSTDVAAVPISDLKSGTLYEVEASLESDYSQSATTTFTTEGSSLTGITISEVMQESAKATIGIEAPNGQSLAIFVRHRKVTNPANTNWTSADTSSTDTSAMAPLSNLTSGTEYEVQASLDSELDSPTATVLKETFTTDGPSLSGLTVMSVSLTGATIKANIQAPNGESLTVNYRYRPVTQTDWTTTATDAGSDSATSTTESAEFTLSGLSSGTQYEVQATLDSDLDNPTLPVLEATFTTLTPDPSISDVDIDAKQTTAKATITIANPGTSGNTVHLHFRVQNTNAWSSPALTSTTSTTETTIDMTSLTERTTYEVEVALNSGFTSSTTVTFTTLVTPTITSVSVDDVTKTTATATVAIANPDGTARTVNLRYREKDASPADTWATDMEDTSTGSQEFKLTSLKPGTTYEVEASFDSNFVTGVEDTEFTTTYVPSISSVSVGSITKTTATATVSIANPDGTSRTVYLQYRKHNQSPEAEWTKPTPKDTSAGSETFDLTSLTPGTTYEVQASFGSSFSPHKDTTFTTEFVPSISGVSIGSIEKTTATATVVIANPDGTNKTVNLRYREYNKTPEAAWTSTTPKDTATGSTTFDLSSLTPGTTYEVQSSFDSNFGTYKDTTFTTKFPPTISSVSVGSITKTTAVATVIIANPDGATQTVQLQYRIRNPQGNWTSTQDEETTTGSATINLTGLTAGTTYDVEVSLTSGFGDTQTTTFTTTPPPPPPQKSPSPPPPPVTKSPEVASISVTNETQTTADATVKIDNAGTAKNTVNLRYSVDGENSWTDHTKTEAGSAVSFPLSGLTAGTTYEVEAWLGSDTDNKVTETFTTSMAPSISSIVVGGITKTSATATINIANPGDAQNTVNLRYSVDGEDSWTDHTKTETGSTVEFPLSSLTAGTTYEVEAWLGSDTDNKVTETFTTSMAPSISSIGVGGITKTSATATVNIANPGDAQNTVNLRYSVDGEDSWTDHTKTEAGSAVSFPLSSLTAGTTYEVEAWLGSDTDNKVTETFTTSMAPSISSIGVGGITKTSATATVNIANLGDAQNTVNLRYSVDGEDSWTDHTKTEAGSAVSFPLSSLTAGTTYEVEAWLGSDTDNKVTETFTTSMAPSISSIGVGGITKTSATATVNIANLGDAQNTVNLRYSVDGEDSWTDHTKTEAGSAVSFPLSSLTAGTTYEVEAWLGSDADNKVTATFTTSMAPSISSIDVGGITKTSATATVNIANPGDAQNTVNLRYSVDGEDSWTDHTKTEAGSAVSFPLSSLTAGTTYEVEAWLGSDTDNKVTETFTTSMAPSISSIGVGGITKTSATATVNIANPGDAQNTVNLRYSVQGANSWTDHTKTEAGSTVEFPLSSLTAGTTYEVEAWLGSDTDNKVTATFMTTQAVAVTPPSISSVSVTNETQTTADATVNIDDAGTAQNTVNLRYSVDGENSWTDHTKTEAGSTVRFPLSSLTAGTTYEVEAWLGSDTDNKVTATFMTTQAVAVTPPSISSVSVTNETQTTADATVNIDDAGTAQNTVNLRYSVDGENSWTDHTKTEAGSTVRFPLSSLTAGTAYEVEAWLGSDTDNKVTATFTTTQAVAVTPPSISSVSVTNETQTTADATVNIDDAGTAQNTVNLRYSVDGENSWTDHTKTEAGSTVRFPLSSLTAGTAYEVEAWLGSDTDNKVTATFMTIQTAAVTPPSISSVRVRNVTQTSARVIVGLANVNAGQRVYLQYKLLSAQWPTTSQNTTHTNSIATFNLSSLTAGTGYHIRVSLNSDMSDATTRSLTTLPPQQNPPRQRSPVVLPPSVSSVTFDNETQTSADATVNIATPGTAKKTVRLQYRVDGTTAWSTPPKSENTSGSSATFAMTNLTAATTYEVQAWLNTNSPPSGAQIYTFTTLANDPGISNLKMENIRQTSATAMVEIADAGTEMKEVYLKHSIDGADEWSQLPFPTITYSDSTSVELTGLEEQTTYQVMVDLTNGFNKPKGSTFTTLAAPSLSGVSISSITQTGAVATATIADAGTAQKTVYLRFREFGESQWSTAQTKTTTGASAAFNLTGLDPRTIYEVQASLDIEFGTSKYAVFTTLSPDPSVSGVSVGSITQTSATATMTIAYPGLARKTVHLHYRVSGETEWGAVQIKATSGGSAAIDLTGLSPRTMYEVEASLSSDFAGSKTATFSTLSLDPSVSGVSIGSITQTSAAATVTIANPGTAQKIVYLQYRVDGTSEWSDSALTATTDGPNATIYMTGLIADTEYEVRASLASDFALAQHATFSTLRYPSIYDVDVTDITKTTATAEIDIADPDGSSQTVHLRHRTTTPQGEWSSTFTTASTTGEASIDLTGLTVDTEYEVEASLTADFAIAVSDAFRTLPPDPVVAEVSVNNIRQTTATAAIDIANSTGSSQPVSLRYRTTTPRGNWSDIQTTTSTTDSASIDLTELTPGAEYDVQASLENSFPSSRTRHDTFTTLRWPNIASFEVENVGRNAATVSATIADSRGVAQTVYVRHRATGYIAWRPTQQMDSVDDIASLRLRGLSSGTEYIAEASLDSSFPDGGTRSVTFTTKERDDDDDASSSGSGIVQAARSANIPLLGFSPQMLRFVAIEGGDNPAPQAFSVWNRAQGSMSFNLSNHEEWLSQQPMSGVSSGPDDPVTITASVDSSELASGQYVDVVNIDMISSGKSPGQVIVVLDVLPPDYIRQFVSRDEGGVVVLPDGTVKIVVQPLSPPKDVDIELMKVNLQAHGQPPGEQERVVVAIESNTYEPGGDTPEDVAYAPYVELWVQLPQEDAAACDESRARVYSVQSGAWSLIEHRCETDDSGHVWAVTQVERLGQFALVIDDAAVAATPTPVAAAVMPTPTAIPASVPAVAVQRLSLPAQPPTPTPTPISVPTPVPMTNGKTTVAPAMAPTPTPTAVPAVNEPSAPTMQASASDGGSGGFGKIILAALGVPMLIGALIVVYLLYRERRRRDEAGGTQQLPT